MAVNIIQPKNVFHLVWNAIVHVLKDITKSLTLLGTLNYYYCKFLEKSIIKNSENVKAFFRVKICEI